MANHPSAEKRNRQRIKRTVRNRGVRSAVRTALKKARTALATGDQAAAAPLVRAASIALAKAASKNVLHPRAASRTTSRIMAQLHRLSAS
jgi:small subunit ribosomal protein S20